MKAEQKKIWVLKKEEDTDKETYLLDEEELSKQIKSKLDECRRQLEKLRRKEEKAKYEIRKHRLNTSHTYVGLFLHVLLFVCVVWFFYDWFSEGDLFINVVTNWDYVELFVVTAFMLMIAYFIEFFENFSIPFLRKNYKNKKTLKPMEKVQMLEDFMIEIQYHMIQKKKEIENYERKLQEIQEKIKDNEFMLLQDGEKTGERGND